jgi:hypothetical protein
VNGETACALAKRRIDGMRLPPRSMRSSMRDATLRTIWSIRDSPASRDSSASGIAGVLVILPSQYLE